MKATSFDKIRKIKDSVNRSHFQLYLNDVFHDLSIKSEKSNKDVITKFSLMKYLNIPYFISDKLFKVLSPVSKELYEEDFITSLNLIYNGSLEESVSLIFRMLDFDDDGFIIPEDVRLVLSFIISTNKNKNVDDVDDLIKNFFNHKNQINLDLFTELIENYNSDIFVIIFYFILENAPFSENSLNIYQMDESRVNRKKLASTTILNKIGIKSSLIMDPSKLKLMKNSLITPSYDLEKILKIDMLQFESEDESLADLEKTTMDEVELPSSMSVKTLDSLGPDKLNLTLLKNKTKEKLSISAKNLVTLNLSTYENYIYKFEKINGQFVKKKIYLMLINQDLYYFKGKTKEKIRKFHNLSNCFIKDEIQNYKYKDTLYYSFSIKFMSSNVTKVYCCKDITQTRIWINSLKSALKQRDIRKHYKFIRSIGEGGFATVFLAEDFTTESKVAIKVFNKDNKSESDLENIYTEIEIIRFCQHDNIIKYIDSYEDEENIYLVEEYMNIGDLNDLILRKYLDEEDQIKIVVYQIGLGLKYLHSYGIIHRDLKPQNLLLRNEYSKGAIVKISDFGLSKIMGLKETSTDCLGTIFFTPPEVLLRQTYNSKVDVWSLGVIFYYLLFGVLPFDDESGDIKKIAQKILHEELVFKNKFKIPSDAVELIKKCLQKDCQKRININDFLNHKWFKEYIK